MAVPSAPAEQTQDLQAGGEERESRRQGRLIKKSHDLYRIHFGFKAINAEGRVGSVRVKESLVQSAAFAIVADYGPAIVDSAPDCANLIAVTNAPPEDGSSSVVYVPMGESPK